MTELARPLVGLAGYDLDTHLWERPCPMCGGLLRFVSSDSPGVAEVYEKRRQRPPAAPLSDDDFVGTSHLFSLVCERAHSVTIEVPYEKDRGA